MTLLKDALNLPDVFRPVAPKPYENVGKLLGFSLLPEEVPSLGDLHGAYLDALRANESLSDVADSTDELQGDQRDIPHSQAYIGALTTFGLLHLRNINGVRMVLTRELINYISNRTGVEYPNLKATLGEATDANPFSADEQLVGNVLQTLRVALPGSAIIVK